MLSPRVYWLCPHETLRYEEVPLLIEAGAEVIPNYGHQIFLKYYKDYNNEDHKLYPPWRKKCTLPSNIVEKIREIKLWEKKGEVTDEEAQLINRWIDVIFVATYPDILENISKWYQGYTVFRAFGWNDGITSYTEVTKRLKIDINDLAGRDKYVWCPILNSLGEREDFRLVTNKFYLNAFVSSERLGYKWKGKDSKLLISTLASNLDSYYEENLIFRNMFQSFIEKFKHIPFLVLGKNSKNTAEEVCDKVLGYVDDNVFYSTIAESRVFVYFGLGSNYHLHFTPIEAISMGVPVVFLKESGLAQEARNYGINNEELKKIGMCSSMDEIEKLIFENINNFDRLEEIAYGQSKVFGKIFSRKAALLKAKKFFIEIQPYIKEHRKIEYKKPIDFIKLESKALQGISIQNDLPSHRGERIIFSIEEVNGVVGKLVYDYKGRFIARRVEKNLDSPGLIIANYLGRMEPGEYAFTVELNNFSEYKGSIGDLSVGVWNPQFKVISSQNVSNLKAGRNIVRLVVSISSESSDAVKEINFLWNGAHTCELSRVIVEKVR